MCCRMEKVYKTKICIQIQNVSKQIYILVIFRTVLEKFAIAIKSQAWLLIFVLSSGLFEPRIIYYQSKGFLVQDKLQTVRVYCIKLFKQ